MIKFNNMIAAILRLGRSKEDSGAGGMSPLIEELMAVSAQGIIILGAQNIEFCNTRARELNGVPPSVLSVGKPWMQFFQFQMDRGDFGEGVVAQKFMERLLRNFKERKVMQVERMGGDGRVIRADRVPNSLGGMTLTLTDITDLKAKEAELRAIGIEAKSAERAKSDFLANMGHELRTPLNGILGMAEVLAASELDDDLNEAAQTIFSSAEAMIEVVDEVMEISKLDLGKVTLQSTKFDICKMLRSIVSVNEAVAAKKGLKMNLFLPDELPFLIADTRLLRHSVSQVVENAVRFTENGAVDVVLTAEALPNSKMGVRIAVKDTGIGIKEEDQKKIFERFTQVESGRNRRHDGAGLGLSLAKGYLEMMGGQINVKSTIGHGACFTIELQCESIGNALAA